MNPLEGVNINISQDIVTEHNIKISVNRGVGTITTSDGRAFKVTVLTRGANGQESKQLTDVQMRETAYKVAEMLLNAKILQKGDLSRASISKTGIDYETKTAEDHIDYSKSTELQRGYKELTKIISGQKAVDEDEEEDEDEERIGIGPLAARSGKPLERERVEENEDDDWINKSFKSNELEQTQTDKLEKTGAVRQFDDDEDIFAVKPKETSTNPSDDDDEDIFADPGRIVKEQGPSSFVFKDYEHFESMNKFLGRIDSGELLKDIKKEEREKWNNLPSERRQEIIKYAIEKGKSEIQQEKEEELSIPKEDQQKDKPVATTLSQTQTKTSESFDDLFNVNDSEIKKREQDSINKKDSPSKTENKPSLASTQEPTKPIRLFSDEELEELKVPKHIETRTGSKANKGIAEKKPETAKQEKDLPKSSSDDT